MATLNSLICLCLLIAPVIQGYRTTKSDKGYIIVAEPDETIDIICHNGQPMAQANCRLTHPNSTTIIFAKSDGPSTCEFTTVASTAVGLWICNFGTENKTTLQESINMPIGVELAHSFLKIEVQVLKVEELREIVTDDEPIVISTTTYIVSTLAFLCIFVALVYWKYQFYTRYYGKTWGEDESIHSNEKEQDSLPVIQAGDFLLIT